MTEDNGLLMAQTAIDIKAVDVTGNDVDLDFNQGSTVLLTIPYPDKDQDGIVDGTAIKEDNLRIWQFTGNNWQLVTTNTGAVNKDKNTVTVMINELGRYAVMELATEPVISNVVVYPDPFSDIAKFMFSLGSQADVKVQIYTLTGRFISELSKHVGVNDTAYVEFVYDGTDKQGALIANGTYIYKIVTVNNNKSYTKTGKFMKLK
jgi:hypothetical protein